MIGASAVEHADKPEDVLDAWTDIVSFLLADNGIKVELELNTKCNTNSRSAYVKTLTNWHLPIENCSHN
jgi:hypothetical protein